MIPHFGRLVFAMNTKGNANGPNKMPMANQKGLLAFRFAAIKYNSAPKNTVAKIRYIMLFALCVLFWFVLIPDGLASGGGADRYRLLLCSCYILL